MRTSRIIRWTLGGLIGLIGLALCYHYFVLDWKERPYCHKQIMFGFIGWAEENGMDINSPTNTFPNLGGAGLKSLAAISNGMAGHMTWAKNYRYVPGLRKDDPGHLVLMYLDSPTRWTWHGTPPTIFTSNAWIIVPVDFKMGDSRPAAGPGELSERVSQAEFRSRLTDTLDFIRTNQRPNWPTIVAEHTKFLESLGQVGR